MLNVAPLRALTGAQGSSKRGPRRLPEGALEADGQTINYCVDVPFVGSVGGL